MTSSFPCNQRFEVTRVCLLLAWLLFFVIFQIGLGRTLMIDNEEQIVLSNLKAFRGELDSRFQSRNFVRQFKDGKESAVEKARLIKDQAPAAGNGQSVTSMQVPEKSSKSKPRIQQDKEAAKRENSNHKHNILDEMTLKRLKNSGVQVADLDDETLSKIPSWDVVESFLGSSTPHIIGLETCAAFQTTANASPFRFIGVSGMFNCGTNLLFNLLRKNCILEAPSGDEEENTGRDTRAKEESQTDEKSISREQKKEKEETYANDEYDILDTKGEETDDGYDDDDDWNEDDGESEETDNDAADEDKNESENEETDNGANEDDDASESEEVELESRALFQVPWGKHTFAWQRDTRVAPGYEQYNTTQTLVVVSVRNPFYFMESMCRNSYVVKYQKRQRNTTCPHLVDHNSGEFIPVSLRMKETPYTFRSIVHYWNYWHRQYMRKFTHPRLFVRMEDLTVHPKETIKAVCECAGGAVVADEDFKFMVSSAKEGLGHGKAGESNGLVEAWSRIGRAMKFPFEDTEAAKTHLDRHLMEAFLYQPPAMDEQH